MDLHAHEQGEVAFGGQAMDPRGHWQEGEEARAGVIKAETQSMGVLGECWWGSAKAISVGKGSRYVVTKGDVAGWGARGKRLA